MKGKPKPRAWSPKSPAVLSDGGHVGHCAWRARWPRWHLCLSVGLFAHGLLDRSGVRGLYSEPVGFWGGGAVSLQTVLCERAVRWSGCLLVCAHIASAPDVVPGPGRGHLGELPTWSHSPLSQAPDISFMAKLGTKRPPKPPPVSTRWGEAQRPHGQSEGRGAHPEALFWLLAFDKCFLGMGGGEPWKEGFKSSAL